MAHCYNFTHRQVQVSFICSGSSLRRFDSAIQKDFPLIHLQREMIIVFLFEIPVKLELADVLHCFLMFSVHIHTGKSGQILPDHCI